MALTDNGREFCGTERHPYELILEIKGMDQHRIKVRNPKTNGFVERFNGTVLEEFFRITMREKFYDSVQALQQDLNAWLRHYHRETRSGLISGTETRERHPPKPSIASSGKKVKRTV